ncbi:hypothetical protein FRB94_003218 [Tulasnella sp. JGI-2019a]|nr:hypothetical protein FRB93_004145 [Tulasnella sp. JGI-2019a]KAG9003334.1 hypothetical protein FRB94_003218 [Tulasnella sp. JGI-2019a]KAG9028919.1 hypothetical protein FRB95_005917 [Tulasnella sp. JGI-2019a]
MASNVNQYIGRALACLVDGARDQAIRSLDSRGRRQQMLQELDLLQSLYKTLGQCIQRHIAETKRQLNLSAPIYSLPNELLIEIFALVHALDYPHLGNLCLIRLGLVSTDWGRIVFETPSLWGHISTIHPVEQNRTAIRLSKGYPVRVAYYHDYMGSGGSETAFIRFASQEAHRWQMAHFHVGDYTLPLLHDFAALSVPRLEELLIDCSTVPEELLQGVSINIFGGVADRLRHVTLCDPPVPWSSRLLSRLETLSISSRDAHFAPTTSEITAILRQCPDLRAFSLFELGGDEIHVSGAAPSEAETVHLPALTSFVLQLRNAEVFNRIISSIRIPACTEFDLECFYSTGNPFSSGARHFTSALSSAI